MWNMFKVNNKNTVNFEHILHLCVSIVDFEQINVSWVRYGILNKIVHIKVIMIFAFRLGLSGHVKPVAILQ